MAAVLATIASIASIGGAGVGIGTSIANAVSGPSSTPGTPAIAKPSGPTPSQVTTATQAGNNLISQTGGGLSPEALAQLTQMLDTSGQSFGGAGQSAANNIYGTPG
jgi:hypothetical protein